MNLFFFIAPLLTLFGLFVFSAFILLVGVSIWLMQRSKFVGVSDKYHLIKVLRGAVLSFFGVVIIFGIVSFAVFIIKIIVNYFDK